MLYQIGSKFRDELRPKLGVIRSKEFLMKDLYSFDRNHTDALITYDKVSEAYKNIFNHIGVKYVKGRVNILPKIKRITNILLSRMQF